MQLISVNPIEFGLTDETAQNIKDQFLPMLNKMVELEEKFNEVLTLPLEDPNTSKFAKELRKEYVVVRKTTEDIHKKQKAFYLNGGRYVDGWKNAQIFASQGKEEELKRIENYLEDLEKARVDELINKRIGVVMPYIDDPESISRVSIGAMDDDIFMAYVEIKKKAYNERLEAERIAHVERMAQENRAKLHDSRRLELMDYWNFLDEEVKIMNFGVMSEKYFNGLIVDLKRRKAENDAEQERLRKENQAIKQEYAKKQAEFEELQRKEAERQKTLEEERLKSEKEAKKMAKAPIKKQMKLWVESFELPDPPQDDVALEIMFKFNSFKSWALMQIESI